MQCDSVLKLKISAIDVINFFSDRFPRHSVCMPSICDVWQHLHVLTSVVAYGKKKDFLDIKIEGCAYVSLRIEAECEQRMSDLPGRVGTGNEGC
jgi:hypothetical protein